MSKPVERISKGIVRVLGLNPGPFTLQGTNTYVIGNGHRRLLVDTGDGAQPEYLTLLRQTLDGSQIDQILLTHWHPDHVGGLPLLLHSDLVTPDLSIYKRHDTEHPVDGAKNIVDGQTFVVDEMTLTAVLTPGHTNDHVAFLINNEQKILVTGDLILGQGTTIVDELMPYMQSLDRVRALMPEVLLPGHGPVIQGDTEGQSNAVRVIDGYIAHRKMREKQILQTIAGTPPTEDALGWSVEQITAAVYPDIIDPRVVWAAQKNVRLHLDKLVSEKKVKQVADPLDPQTSLWTLI
ncbi:Beta-lactamase-like protein 2 [Coemansia sp. RSA 486]|nr:Beta-lactamase-like protein 2 [Coemansia sp. RSA 486]